MILSRNDSRRWCFSDETVQFALRGDGKVHTPVFMAWVMAVTKTSISAGVV